MGIKHLLEFFVVTIFIGVATGCAEKDLYDPNYGKEPVKGADEYFGFETRGDVPLNVNYDAVGFTTLIEVYDADPMEVVEGTPVKKAGVEAIFKIYTDANGKYEGTMNIPTAVNSVYLYTETWGLPRCVKLGVENGVVKLDLSRKTFTQSATKTTTRAYQFTGSAPYTVNSGYSLYSLCQWGKNGDLAHGMDGNAINPGYIANVTSVGEESMGDFVERMMDFFIPEGKVNVDNSELVKTTKTTNLTVTKETILDVVFVNRDASWDNTFGYYYYKTDDKNVNIYSLKKYIIFPNVKVLDGNQSILKCGDKARLMFYDEKGKASEKFPAGYTVGWFLVSNGYNKNNNEIAIDDRPTSVSIFKKGENGQTGGFVSVADKTSGKVIVGVEDGNNNSYCDLLFYVDASDSESIDDTDRPTIPEDPEKPEKPDVVETKTGTLAFEDIWPDGGDYDMNDVIVEYNRAVSFDKKNQVTKIVDTFTPVHDGAVFANAFAYQIDKGQFGRITSSATTEGIRTESATSSIIVCPNVKQAIKKVYTITREFTGSSFNKKDLKSYNPYIIVKYAEGEKGRTEVHLPKHEGTSLADLSLAGTGKDAYYIDKDGAYPFAIDIPVLNFIPVTEKKSIDTEYPYFKAWADSQGKEYADWYKNHGN